MTHCHHLRVTVQVEVLHPREVEPLVQDEEDDVHEQEQEHAVAVAGATVSGRPTRALGGRIPLALPMYCPVACAASPYFRSRSSASPSRPNARGPCPRGRRRRDASETTTRDGRARGAARNLAGAAAGGRPSGPGGAGAGAGGREGEPRRTDAARAGEGGRAGPPAEARKRARRDARVAESSATGTRTWRVNPAAARRDARGARVRERSRGDRVPGAE